MNNVEIISEKIQPPDLWEQFCAKFGGIAVPRMRIDEGKFYADNNWCTFKLAAIVVMNRMAFEIDQEAFWEHMEESFHSEAKNAMSKMREELNILRSAGQKNEV